MNDSHERNPAGGAIEPNAPFGDGEITEQILAEYGPYLRMVVRRRMNDGLRSQFDSEDVLQSVWIHLISRFRKGGCNFESAQELRSFLWQVTSHRLTDRIRKARRALSHEVSTDGASLDEIAADGPSPSQAAHVADLWCHLLSLCPPRHVQILKLRREGHGYKEIAERLGMHVSSIRRIIYNLARRITSAVDATHTALETADRCEESL